MTHSGDRWTREPRDLLDVRIAASVRLLGEATIATGRQIEIEEAAWAALGRYPCRGCGAERVCVLAYDEANEGRDASECERERRT